jgi:hypothetical protein
LKTGRLLFFGSVLHLPHIKNIYYLDFKWLYTDLLQSMLSFPRFISFILYKSLIIINESFHSSSNKLLSFYCFTSVSIFFSSQKHIIWRVNLCTVI